MFAKEPLDEPVFGYLCFALHFAHLALCAAAIRLREAGDIERRWPIEITLRPLTLAHRARWAALMRAIPAAEIL
jgi:hypothetical protein